MKLKPLLAGLALLPPASATAQTSGAVEASDTTVIYATVPVICTVDVESPATVIQLAAGSEQDLTSVVYTCNSAAGFSRTITSQNNGVLRRGSQQIAYLISQTGSGDLAVPSTSLAAPRADSVTTFDELTIGSSGQLRARISAVPPGLLAGDYTDTVTIEITPN